MQGLFFQLGDKGWTYRPDRNNVQCGVLFYGIHQSNSINLKHLGNLSHGGAHSVVVAYHGRGQLRDLIHDGDFVESPVKQVVHTFQYTKGGR